MKENFTAAFRDDEPADSVEALADYACALVRLTRFALNHADELDMAQAVYSARNSLELAEACLERIAEGCEELTRAARRGVWVQRKEAAA